MKNFAPHFSPFEHNKAFWQKCTLVNLPFLTHSCLLSAPVLTVMDGFGRELLDQYYKVGSSLEVMCKVDKLPQRPLPEIIEWRHGTNILPNVTYGQRYDFIIVPSPPVLKEIYCFADAE